ncbi:hypothetical protein [Nocardia aurea]|uniref:Uncharacterized protein n=1 Tax=Nocardia aurea TaxID=2144174 RepID=A0ABV3G1C0_9NOCA
MKPEDLALVVNEDGTPRGVVDVAQIQSTATILMYEMASAAGNDDELDRIGIEWTETLDPDEFGYVSAAALSLLVRNVLAPVLQVLAELSPELEKDLRAKLVESRDYAQATLGGGR